ncbi:MAG TPA: ketopantoate reductase C-terminal domain-containing protein, partial [Afipia sp.]
MILPVLNGMRQVDAITERFGSKALTGCVCKVATHLDGEGRIVQMNKLQDFAYGEMSGEVTDRIRRLDTQMQGAGFDARLSADIELEMWEKWALLSSLGGITCLARGNIGEVVATPGGVEFASGIFDEVTSIIGAVGRKPSDVFLKQSRALLTLRDSVQTSSMYRDLEKGYPLEACQIIGDLLQRAQKSKIAAPLLSAVFVNLSVYQNRLVA